MSAETEQITAKPSAETSSEMNGADIVIESLIREGVDVIFAYPGGASMEFHQSLAKRKDKIRTILPRHEQGGSFAAEGYARATGKPGVCMATSGPGATNLMTAIADAYMDSTPLIAITGQVYSKFIGKAAFQETDFFGMTLPVVKHSFLVMNTEELPRIMKKAFKIATTGRPGPVVIDVPKDVQQNKILPNWDAEIDLLENKYPTHASDGELKNVLRLVEEAKRPMVYYGGGIVASESYKELQEFIERTGIPCSSTLMGVGAFPETHDLSLKWFGMHGSAYGNLAVHNCDLLLAFGVRFDDRITGDVSKFAPQAEIVHIDVDASEHNKNKIVHHPIVSDIKFAMGRMNELMPQIDFAKPDLTAWLDQIDQWKTEYPFEFEDSPHILGQEAVRVLYELTDGEAIITTGVGQHQMWAAQFYDFKYPRSHVSSLGLGSMGYGYPSALGAKVACPDREVIDIDGDGSFVMNIQELATAKIEKIAAKALILNNQHLGMVMQWEDRFYDSVRGNTILGDENNIGSPENIDALYPDYVKIANGFGLPARRVHKREELRDAVQEMLDSEEAFVLDVITPYTEHVMPMIPAGKSVDQMIIK